MVGLPCLVGQCAKLHVAGWMWAVFTRVSGEFYDFYSVSPEYFGYTLVFVCPAHGSTYKKLQFTCKRTTGRTLMVLHTRSYNLPANEQQAELCNEHSVHYVKLHKVM
jgi:hypothetical protein